MASSKRTVVQTVFRDHSGEKPASRLATVNHNTPQKPVSAKVAAARASRPPTEMKRPGKTILRTAKIVPTGVKPVVYKKDMKKPLIKRLNPILLAQLQMRKVTNRAAAEALGVHETYLSRVVSSIQSKAQGATSALRDDRAKLFKARKQTRETLAKMVNKGEKSLDRAAKEANCTVRTMRRYCEKYANLRK